MDNWHTVHLGSRAVGGAGLVMVGATAVTPEGRISPGDAGIWNETQVEAWAKLAGLIASHGAVPAIQLAHAGWAVPSWTARLTALSSCMYETVPTNFWARR
ncbi:hypothetical protein BH11PLA2_BH11PLA2_53110 [soil metagenome]